MLLAVGLTDNISYVKLCLIMLTNKQVDKISDLFMDIARGLFLASFTVPIVTPLDSITFTKMLVAAIFCTYFSLKLTR